MFGSAGGCLEFRAAQLASRGIVAFALAFFAYDDLPANPIHLEIDYFNEAVSYLLKQPFVKQPTIGVIGVSKGGDLALSLATFNPSVSVAFCINGSIANLQWPLKFPDGSCIKPIPTHAENTKVSNMLSSTLNIFFMLDIIEQIMDDETLECGEAQGDPLANPETVIPIEKAVGDIIFVVGTNDVNLNTLEHAKLAQERMLKHGKTNFKVNNLFRYYFSRSVF